MKRFNIVIEDIDFFTHRNTENRPKIKLGEGVVFNNEVVVAIMYKPLGVGESKTKEEMSFYRSFEDFNHIVIEGKMLQLEWLDYPGELDKKGV